MVSFTFFRGLSQKEIIRASELRGCGAAEGCE
jgi:hypothetical protein